MIRWWCVIFFTRVIIYNFFLILFIYGGFGIGVLDLGFWIRLLGLGLSADGVCGLLGFLMLGLSI